MTSPSWSEATLPDIGLDCEAKLFGCTGTATRWIGCHPSGVICGDRFLCFSCLMHIQKTFDKRCRIDGEWQCPSCGQHFSTFAEAVIVREL